MMLITKSYEHCTDVPFKDIAHPHENERMSMAA